MTLSMKGVHEVGEVGGRVGEEVGGEDGAVNTVSRLDDLVVGMCRVTW